jgi:hypothetical protein
MISIATYPEAVAAFRRGRRRRFACPSSLRTTLAEGALEVLDALGSGELSGDLVLCTGREIQALQRKTNYVDADLGSSWNVFGRSGTGDLWLCGLKRHPGEVAFLDHDQEREAIPRPLGIRPTEWVQLAYILWQYEQLEVSGRGPLKAAKREALAAMESLSLGLATRYPYSLD